MSNNLSENLKRIRKDNNLSQEQLAEELGVSRQAVSKWESGVAYPEMEKIIQLCAKFDMNIDDLLNKDVREAKSEEESKRSINKIIDNFLNFITDTINLFYNMNLKSKIKCLIEQGIIIIILFIICLSLNSILNGVIIRILTILPPAVAYYILNIINAIFIMFELIASTGICIHIFKTRYLDYYAQIKNESAKEIIKTEKEDLKEFPSEVTDNSEHQKNKILFKRNESKIVIRDPKDSEYGIVHSIFKVLVIGIKFGALLLLATLCIGLIFLIAGFVASFCISKTGIFFIGILLAFVSASVIDLVLILMLINFIFNRKNNKKKMIWTFLFSIILLGISGGLIFIGSLKFEYISLDEKSDMFEISKIDVTMNENLFITPYIQTTYVEKDIENIEIEIKRNKFYAVVPTFYMNEISFYGHPINMGVNLNEIIKNLNDFKIINLYNELYRSGVYKVNVYASKDNITKLKENQKKFLKKQNHEQIEYQIQYEDN